MEREAPENRLAGRPQLHDDLPPVRCVASPLDHSSTRQSVDEPDDAVLAKLEPFGEDPDGRRLSTL